MPFYSYDYERLSRAASRLREERWKKHAPIPAFLTAEDSGELGAKPAEKIRDTRVVLWAAHGIFGTGRDMDETFGLIETVEKAAEIYIKIQNVPWKQSITDAELAALCEEFGLTPRAGYLDV